MSTYINKMVYNKSLSAFLGNSTKLSVFLSPLLRFFCVDNGARISYNNYYTDGHVMKIVAMTNKKGGVGKTTAALCGREQ